MSKPLILVELNEVNFDIVKMYIDSGKVELSNFAKLIDSDGSRCLSEDKYAELEPWIQWVSVHTGLAYKDHQVFRLGDIIEAGHPQIFERVESAGFRVGGVSPMNAANRLASPAYFIPDPWTCTPSDPSALSRNVTAALSQTVNDNAQARITASSFLAIIGAFVRCAPPRHYLRYAKLFLGSLLKRWKRAMFLDLLIHDIHMHLFKSKRPDFSTVFFNAGAHIQHHYMLNSAVLNLSGGCRNPEWYIKSNQDPLQDLLKLYDFILGEIINSHDIEYVVATGLTQKPYDRVKFYYRLKDHRGFLDKMEIKYLDVQARMTRDFLIRFDTADDARVAQAKLDSVVHGESGVKMFADIDNRGDNLFVTMTYPEEIGGDAVAVSGEHRIPMKDEVVFVAIKNGMHSPDCFVYSSPALRPTLPASGSHVKGIFNVIDRYFGERSL